MLFKYCLIKFIMPLIKLLSPKKYIFLGLWEISESFSELLKLYHPLIPDNEFEKFKNEKRRKQWLAVRVLLKILALDNNLIFQGIKKDEFNKPHSINAKYHISIAHAGKYATAIINTIEPTGIDIETVSAKVEKIKNKFLSEDELKKTQFSLKELCVYWSAKEVLYKYYGKKNVIFKKELRIIKEFESLSFRGKIIKEDFQKSIPIKLICKGDHIIVFCY